ncbi:MAG: sodium:calcium antiporter [marine bacterium B5-7]|nr:MAG: sodium:calcium antiporter [marine bacterium B5-7]
MTLHIISLLLSFLVLVFAADSFVKGASRIACRWHVSPLLIGLTVVALGTSAPEIVVAITAAVQKQGALAIGSALGSNIANVGIVLGGCALFSPIPVRRAILRREYIVLLLATIVAVLLMMDGDLSHRDGLCLIALFTVFLVTAVIYTRKHRREFSQTSDAEKIDAQGAAWPWLLLGLVLLPITANVFVHHALGIARSLGVHESVVGLSMVAIGTSVPELATSLVGMMKGQHDMAIGNVLGSNIFNLLAVLPFPGLFDPGKLPPHFVSRDLPAVMISTLAIFLVGFAWGGRDGRINRWEGALLLLGYAAYLWILF